MDCVHVKSPDGAEGWRQRRRSRRKRDAGWGRLKETGHLWLETQWAERPNQVLLVRAEVHVGFIKQAKNWLKSKGGGTYWKVKGLAKNMKESTMVIAFLPVVTANENNKQESKVHTKDFTAGRTLRFLCFYFKRMLGRIDGIAEQAAGLTRHCNQGAEQLDQGQDEGNAKITREGEEERVTVRLHGMLRGQGNQRSKAVRYRNSIGMCETSGCAADTSAVILITLAVLYLSMMFSPLSRTLRLVPTHPHKAGLSVYRQNRWSTSTTPEQEMTSHTEMQLFRVWLAADYSCLVHTARLS